MDLFGTEAAQAALDLGVLRERVCTVASDVQLSGATATGAHAADSAGLGTIAAGIAGGTIAVPVEASFPVERIREAVELQSAGHVHGKVMITFWLDRRVHEER